MDYLCAISMNSVEYTGSLEKMIFEGLTNRNEMFAFFIFKVPPKCAKIVTEYDGLNQAIF